jgi:hypothetical protein
MQVAAVGEFFARSLSKLFLVPSVEDYECAFAQRVVCLAIGYCGNIERLRNINTACGKS